MKRHKGRVSRVPLLGNIRQGEYSIVSTESGRVTVEQMKAIIMTLKRKMPTGTTIIGRLRGNIGVTAKPLEVRMGKGKGSIAKRVARVRPNRVIVEVKVDSPTPATTTSRTPNVVPPGQIITGLQAAASKIPVRVRIVYPVT